MINEDMVKTIASILAKTRNEAGVSQDSMAIQLGMSRNTVSNVEKGTSQLTLPQIMEWFDVCGTTPIRSILEMLHPQTYAIQPNEDNQKMLTALDNFLRDIPPIEQEGIAYIFLGQHGSDAMSVIQLMVAYLHLPLQFRSSIARHIVDNYDICNSIDQLVCNDSISPNLDLLEKSIIASKHAISHGRSGYVATDKN